MKLIANLNPILSRVRKGGFFVIIVALIIVHY